MQTDLLIKGDLEGIRPKLFTDWFTVNPALTMEGFKRLIPKDRSRSCGNTLRNTKSEMQVWVFQVHENIQNLYGTKKWEDLYGQVANQPKIPEFYISALIYSPLLHLYCDIYGQTFWLEKLFPFCVSNFDWFVFLHFGNILSPYKAALFISIFLQMSILTSDK